MKINHSLDATFQNDPSRDSATPAPARSFGLDMGIHDGEFEGLVGTEQWVTKLRQITQELNTAITQPGFEALHYRDRLFAFALHCPKGVEMEGLKKRATAMRKELTRMEIEGHLSDLSQRGRLLDELQATLKVATS